jgi:LPS sulfotransferase NodH
MTGDRSVIFCATQRTGSTMIYDDFLSVMGCPPRNSERLYAEIVKTSLVKPWAAVWETLCDRCSVQGVVVEKVMFHYTPYISAAIEGFALERRPPVYTFQPARFDAFYNFFRDATWVYIDRRDVFAQAVSMYFAESTQVWEIRDPAADSPADAARRVPYDRARLLRLLRNFLNERAQWQALFRQYGIAPLCLTYEDASANYPGYLNELIAATGLTPVIPLPPRRLSKVGDAKNEQFAQALRDDVLAELYTRLPPAP